MNYYRAPVCPICGVSAVLELTDTELTNLNTWKSGNPQSKIGLVQDYFGSRPAEWREILLTGMHPECWNSVMES
jgi:hypothetical protein